jgi:hypothetical protein
MCINIKLNFIICLNQFDLFILSGETGFDLVTTDPIVNYFSDSVSDHATYGGSDSDAYDSYESDSSQNTLVDTDEETNLEASDFDSDSSDTDEGYFGDDESDNPQPQNICPDCNSKSRVDRVEAVSEKAVPTPEISAESSSTPSSQAFSESSTSSAPAPSRSSRSSSTSINFFLLNTLRLRLTIFNFLLSEKYMRILTLVSLIAIIKVISLTFVFPLTLLFKVTGTFYPSTELGYFCFCY